MGRKGKQEEPEKDPLLQGGEFARHLIQDSALQKWDKEKLRHEILGEICQKICCSSSGKRWEVRRGQNNVLSFVLWGGEFARNLPPKVRSWEMWNAVSEWRKKKKKLLPGAIREKSALKFRPRSLGGKNWSESQKTTSSRWTFQGGNLTEICPKIPVSVGRNEVREEKKSLLFVSPPPSGVSSHAYAKGGGDKFLLCKIFNKKSLLACGDYVQQSKKPSSLLPPTPDTHRRTCEEAWENRFFAPWLWENGNFSTACALFNLPWDPRMCSIFKDTLHSHNLCVSANTSFKIKILKKKNKKSMKPADNLWETQINSKWDHHCTCKTQNFLFPPSPR